MSRGRNLNKLFRRVVITIACIFLVSSAFSADQQNILLLYPKDHSVVGNKVNVVLDPTDVPYFQVIVNTTEYSVVDTSTGRHAYQGIVLEQGENKITVNILAPSDEKDKKKLSVVASRLIRVYNRDGAFSPVPAGFTQDPFHTRERESSCSSCHRLEATQQDMNPAKPEAALCYTCHREIPKGRHIHGPAALWNCLSCHNPELYPAKYAFSSVDPWKAAKSTQSIEPMVFTVLTADLFKPASAVLTSKAKVKESFGDVLNYIKQNPADRIRLEVHTDNAPLKAQKNKNGKSKGFKDKQSLTSARAKALAAVLKESGVGEKRLIAVGMGDKLAKASNKTQDGRELNNRTEIVVYPSDVKVINSQKLPVLKDRDRVVVSLSYSQGPQVKKLRIVERVPSGLRYVKGSGFLKGKTIDPNINGSELVWELGDRDANFTETLYYVFKKGKEASSVPLDTKVTYVSYEREQSREFDPTKPATRAYTVMEACLKCHPGMVDKKFKHGPADAGYCSLCHDPHASPYSAWLRRPTWDLCTTCHADKGSGAHVLAGFGKGGTHPTKSKRDPARPGKRLACAGCHEPHSAETGYLFAYDVKSRSELCGICHRK
jgi:predicted CXXCH cytochrome family protein